MRILIDMDGVIADFDGEFLKRWRRRHPDKLYIPLEQRNTFYLKDSYPPELTPLVYEILQEATFFLEVLPIPGAKAALEEMRARGWEVFICSSPLDTYNNCVLEKYEWVEKVLGPAWVRQIVLTKDKTIIKGNFLIDDKPAITGVQDPPEWEHIVFDRPYNKSSNKRRLTWDNWKDILLSPRQV